MKVKLLLMVSHVCVGMVGFALGVYFLPILIAPEQPPAEMLTEAVASAQYTAEFKRDLAGSDLLHWGEGTVSIGSEMVAFTGKLAPGPDYKLYFSPVFVETEEAFMANRSSMRQVGDVKRFNNFVLSIDPAIDLTQFTTVIVWCETFGEFITAGRYR